MKKVDESQEITVIAQRLQSVRKAKGFTQSYMAEQMGIACSTYVKLESAAHWITTKNLMNISKILNVTTDLLLFGDTGTNSFNFDEYIACAQLFSDNGLYSLVRSVNIVHKLKEYKQLLAEE